MRPTAGRRGRRWLTGLGLGLPLGLLVLWSVAGLWPADRWWPQTWTGRAWLAIGRTAGEGLLAVTTSLATSLGCVLVCLVATWPAARTLAAETRPWARRLEVLLLTPVFFPPLVWLFGLHKLFLSLGLVDHWLAVVLAQAVLAYPYLLRSLIAGYQVLDPRLTEVARGLGASPLRRLWRIELPLLGPAIIAGALVAFLAAWSDYLLLYLIGGGVIPGLSLILYPFVFSDERGLAAAWLILFSLLPLGLFWLSDRWLHRLGPRLANHRGGPPV